MKTMFYYSYVKVPIQQEESTVSCIFKYYFPIHRTLHVMYTYFHCIYCLSSLRFSIIVSFVFKNVFGYENVDDIYIYQFI